MNIFREWMHRMGFNGKQVTKAGNAIGMTGVRSIQATGTGEREVTETERLAMSAVAAGLEPWSPDYHDKLVKVRSVMDLIEGKDHHPPKEDAA